jgi:hypothetical protein
MYNNSIVSHCIHVYTFFGWGGGSIIAVSGFSALSSKCLIHGLHYSLLALAGRVVLEI